MSFIAELKRRNVVRAGIAYALMGWVLLQAADPKGYLSFGVYLNWCLCGAPFDLEYTPNFAAKIEEAGLPWPPVSPINFPLKDW